MKEIRLWNCNICDTSNNIKSISTHNKSKSHKDKEKFSVVVKKYDFIGPDIDKIDSMFNNCAENCYNK